jgi:hypothetical protein
MTDAERLASELDSITAAERVVAGWLLARSFRTPRASQLIVKMGPKATVRLLTANVWTLYSLGPFVGFVICSLASETGLAWTLFGVGILLSFLSVLRGITARGPRRQWKRDHHW